MAAVSSRPRREHMEPLWDRVDRNRLRLLAYVAAFVAGSVAGFDLLLVVPVFFFALREGGTWADVWTIVGNALLVVSAVIGGSAAAWAGYTLLRSEKWLLRRLGAELVPKGELLDTKFALKDMAIAAGLDVAPALYVIEANSTNAFVFSARRRRPVVGVTRGFVHKLTVDEQRAVFANLVARLVSGDSIVSTGVTALMWPVQAWRESRATANDTEELKAMGAYLQSSREPSRSNPESGGGVILYWFYAVGFAILAEFVAAGHRKAQLTTAEKADAEGMLLLKDPGAMLSALTHCVELDNLVSAAGESFAELFYCWTGVATNDEDDPEWARVARLREVLGVMGFRPEASECYDFQEAGPPPAPRLE